MKIFVEELSVLLLNSVKAMKIRKLNMHHFVRKNVIYLIRL
jgi:hypothetical protein